MNCSNCGRPVDSESNYCKYCGTSLNRETDPQRTIFDTPYQTETKSNIDLGYLIISILILINVFIWIIWGVLFGRVIRDNELLYKSIRILSTVFSIAQFIVMFVFTKRPSYRIVIGVIGGIVILYNLYYLIQTLTEARF
jgi:hypothetical protein